MEALILFLVGSACKRPQLEEHNERVVHVPDLAAVYHADKELQAALSRPVTEREKLPELDRLTMKLKTELSIVQDRVSYDPQLQSFSLLVEQYGKIARAYEAYDEAEALIAQQVNCVAVTGIDPSICDWKYRAKVNAAVQKLSAVGITCFPYQGFAKGGKCDFVNQIAPMESEATRAYMTISPPK